MDRHFIQQRETAANADANLNFHWYKKMEIVFGEIDSTSHCIPPYGALSFLDLGLEYMFPTSSPATLIPPSAVVAQVDLLLMCSNEMLWL